MVLYYIIII